MLTRRKLIGGLGLLIAAPAVIRVAQLMSIKAVPAPFSLEAPTLQFLNSGIDDEIGWATWTYEVDSFGLSPRRSIIVCTQSRDGIRSVTIDGVSMALNA